MLKSGRGGPPFRFGCDLYFKNRLSKRHGYGRRQEGEFWGYNFFWDKACFPQPGLSCSKYFREEEEKDFLEYKAKVLEHQLAKIKKRLEELEK